MFDNAGYLLHAKYFLAVHVVFDLLVAAFWGITECFSQNNMMSKIMAGLEITFSHEYSAAWFCTQSINYG